MKRRRRQTKSITIEEVAQAANCSIMSVSRALRGVEGVSAQRRDQIIEIAAALGYTPNPNARSLVGMNSALIGISLPTLFNDVFADILEGLRPAFESNGFTTIVDTTEYDRARERAWVERVRGWHPAAMVLTGVDHDPQVRQMLRRYQIPTLEVWDYHDDPIDICVGIDHVRTGAQLGREMIALGYRRPGFVGFARGFDLRAEKRLLGLRSAFFEAGLGGVEAFRSQRSNGYRAGYEGFMHLWNDAEKRPDIIFFLSDHFAFAGLMAAQACGANVPGDIGLVGFNALEIISVLPIKMTTAITPRRQMGTVGARSLIARLNNVTTDLSVELTAQLVLGETTRGQDVKPRVRAL